VSHVSHQLDLALTTRLREIVGGEVASESELRGLAEEAEGWLRATGAQLRASEERLTKLNADPASPLAEIAAEVRRAEALSQERQEARRLIDGLEERTRELRTEWLKHHADSGSPLQPNP
jgi:hypothetical protein